MFKNKKGFTLVELIVVVAIMAVLAGTVAGVVVSQENKTKNTQADASAKNLAEQFTIYLNADLYHPEQEYISTAVTPHIWQPANAETGFEGGAKEFIKMMVASYDDGAMITDEDADLPKAGQNTYLVKCTGLSFTIQYREVGTGAKVVTYTVYMPDNSDMFISERSEA